jgi:hypothetical protein
MIRICQYCQKEINLTADHLHYDERAGELVHYDCADLPKEPASTGLGDRVEKVAQPIAKLIDDVFNTDIQNCGGCKSRKKWLNDRFPK